MLNFITTAFVSMTITILLYSYENKKMPEGLFEKIIFMMTIIFVFLSIVS